MGFEIIERRDQDGNRSEIGVTIAAHGAAGVPVVSLSAEVAAEAGIAPDDRVMLLVGNGPDTGIVGIRSHPNGAVKAYRPANGSARVFVRSTRIPGPFARADAVAVRYWIKAGTLFFENPLDPAVTGSEIRSAIPSDPVHTEARKPQTRAAGRIVDRTRIRPPADQRPRALSASA